MGAFTHRSFSLPALVVSAACSSTLCYASEIQVANGRLDGAVSVREDTTYWTNGNQIEIIAKTTDWFPITATSDAVLKFEFRREEGTVLINTLGSYSESAISPQTKPLHLYVKNGSLKIDATGQSYHSSGLIHTYLGKDIDIDKNLTISYKDSKTDPTYTYSGILAEGTNIRVGRSFDISLERVNWEHGKRSDLFGLIGTNANNQMKASWSFGEDDNNSVFKVHDIYSGSESEGVQAGGIILYSEISAPLDLCATIYGYAEITGIYAFTKDMSAMAYAVGAEVGDGAVLDFKKSLIVKNISARNDDSLTSDNLGEKISSGAYGQNAEAYSLNAYDDARILVNSSQEADAVVQIENDMMVDTGAEINAYYLNEESHFYGTVFQNTSEGKVSFKFSDGANWRLTKSNTPSRSDARQQRRRIPQPNL